jgi:hypothetical protein
MAICGERLKQKLIIVKFGLLQALPSVCYSVFEKFFLE